MRLNELGEIAVGGNPKCLVDRGESLAGARKCVGILKEPLRPGRLLRTRLVNGGVTPFDQRDTLLRRKPVFKYL